MSPDNPTPIPVPLRERWHDLRLRVLPIVGFAGAILAIGVLWKNHVAAPSMVGQAEPVLANVSSPKPGILGQLQVVRFQQVKAGDVIASLLVADPRVLEASLAVIRSEIEVLRADPRPVSVQQRTAMDYSQLRLDWMKQRAALAAAQVNLQLAETELSRAEALFKDKVVSEGVLDQAKANQQRLRREVEEFSRLVAEGEESFKALQGTNSTAIAKVSDDSMRAAIAVQEAKLRLTEAELSPIPLRAPIDGIVSAIFHQSGEAVTAGQPVVAIATLRPVRIVGYLRPPIHDEPKLGMQVEVRTRGIRRETGLAQITEVGTQLESLPAAFAGPMKLLNTELGLPVGVSLPANLRIRPGELVDVIFPTGGN
jgi:multidrug resistance efflux pump